MNTFLRCWAEINLEAMRSNLLTIRSFVPAGVRIVAVVKADAYGHGLLEVARDAENKVLPRVYTVNLFDAAGGSLKTSRTYRIEWQREMGFDLPKSLLEVVTHDGTVVTRQMTLSDWKLAK